MEFDKHDLRVIFDSNPDDMFGYEVVELMESFDETDDCHDGTYECPDCGEFEYCGICQHCCECSGCYR